MFPPNVAAIFPPFENPDHFERTRIGRYICKLCPYKSKESPQTFLTEKAALAHERSDDHIFCVDLEKNNPWNVELAANSADWGTEAANNMSGMTPEAIKELEYRRKVEQIPVAVDKWRSSFAAYAHAGEMLPVDKPGRSQRKSSSSKKKKIKSVDVSSGAAKSEPSSEDERSSVQVASGSGGSLPEQPPVVAPKVNPTTPQQSAAPIRPPQRTLPSNSNSPRVELTPALRAWMAEMVIEMRFSPTRAKKMQEFIQLPTDTKVNMVERSAWDLRSLLIT